MLLISITLLLFSAIIALFLAYFILQYRHAPGAVALFVLIFAAAEWSITYALELSSPGSAQKLFWAKLEYVGIVTIPPAWFMFSAQYLRTQNWLVGSRKNQALLGIIPAVTLGLVFTNEIHGLIWKVVKLQQVGSLQVLSFVYGPWFWFFWISCYTLLLPGSIQLAASLLSTARLQRWQVATSLFAVFIPWFANFLYVTRLSPIPGIDWTPFSFTLSGLLLGLSLFRYHLIQIVPIAHQVVFKGLADMVLVLDAQDRIIDLNPAAEKGLSASLNNPLGLTLFQAFPELNKQMDWLDGSAQPEFCVGKPPEQRTYEVEFSPLIDRRLGQIGRLVVLHDITERKLEKENLREALEEQEQKVLERTQALQQANEQLQLELVQRANAEKRFQEIIELAPDALILINEFGQIVLVNAQAERMFGYDRDELYLQDFNLLIPRSRQEEYRVQIREFFDRMQEAKTGSILDFSVVRRDGSEFLVEINLGQLKTIAGTVIACIIRDITERKAAEREQERLLEEIQQSREQLRALAARLQEVQEFERRQIATELHDRVGQNLTGLNLNLRVIHNRASTIPGVSIQSQLDDSLKLVEETTREVRDVLANLIPPLLDEYGLTSALRWHCSEYARRTGIGVEFNGEELDLRLPQQVELVFFRIAQEALTNIAKHAQAKQVQVTLEASAQVACLKVEDDGIGFNPASGGRAGVDASGQPHWGLVTMQERAASIGGHLSILSSPGCGTQVFIEIQR